MQVNYRSTQWTAGQAKARRRQPEARSGRAGTPGCLPAYMAQIGNNIKCLGNPQYQIFTGDAQNKPTAASGTAPGPADALAARFIPDGQRPRVGRRPERALPCIRPKTPPAVSPSPGKPRRQPSRPTPGSSPTSGSRPPPVTNTGRDTRRAWSWRQADLRLDAFTLPFHGQSNRQKNTPSSTGRRGHAAPQDVTIREHDSRMSTRVTTRLREPETPAPGCPRPLAAPPPPCTAHANCTPAPDHRGQAPPSAYGNQPRRRDAALA